MFICFGENGDVPCSTGTGQTPEEAIKNWAYYKDWRDIESEFNRYQPIIVEGEVVHARISLLGLQQVITIQK